MKKYTSRFLDQNGHFVVIVNYLLFLYRFDWLFRSLPICVEFITLSNAVFENQVFSGPILSFHHYLGMLLPLVF